MSEQKAEKRAVSFYTIIYQVLPPLPVLPLTFKVKELPLADDAGLFAGADVDDADPVLAAPVEEAV